MTGLNPNNKRLKISSNPLNITGRFKQRGKEATYQFKLRHSSDVYIALSIGAAQAKIDLQLLNAQKRVIQQSTQPGAASEFIGTTLKQGEYTVRISNKRNSSKTNYSLKIATTDSLPTLATQLLAAAAGQPISLTSNYLRATDSLQAADQLRYKITAAPHNGVLKLNGVALKDGDSFTQADIDQGRISYTRSANQVTVLGNGSRPLVSGFNITWEGAGGSDGGSDQEIFFFDGKTTRQLTQNNVEDKVEGIDGSQVVWSSQVGGVGSNGATTYELNVFNGDTGVTTRLTNNALNEDFVGVDGSNVFWLSPVGGLDRKGQTTYELFYYNGSTTRQLTSNSANEVVGNIEGATAAWSADVGVDDAVGVPTNEIFYFDGNNVQRLTNNAIDDITPLLSHGQVVWAAKSGPLESGVATYELFRFNGSSTQQLTFNDADDALSCFDGDQIVWMSRTGTQNSRGIRTYEIYRSDGVNTQRLTNNNIDDYVIQADGANLLWMNLSGQTAAYGQGTYELYFSNGTTTTRLTNNSVNDLPSGLVGNRAIWYSQVGTPDTTGVATREIFYFNGTTVKQLTTDAKNDDFPSFSATTLAWRSTNGNLSQILRYDLGDSFQFQVSDRSGQSTATQVFNIDFV